MIYFEDIATKLTKSMIKNPLASVAGWKIKKRISPVITEDSAVEGVFRILEKDRFMK